MRKYSVAKLIRVIARLRSRQGCPWDRVQTHHSLKPFLLEEVYETLDAIDRKNPDKLKEELGDLLMQVVLHAQLAHEKKRFDMEDVLRGTIQKLIRRHPHVFGNVKVRGVEDAWRNWERIKAAEAVAPQGAKKPSSYMDGIPRTLPALARADKVQKKAARAGFDWDNVAGAWKKVHEEIAEVEAVLRQRRRKLSRRSHLLLKEEIGDLLFSIVNVSRKLHFHAEELLHQGTRKFIRRFQKLEQKASKNRQALTDFSLDQLDKMWMEVKRR